MTFSRETGGEGVLESPPRAKKDGVRRRAGEQLLVHAIGRKDLPALLVLILLAHGCPDVGVDHVGALDRRRGVNADLDIGAALAGGGDDARVGRETRWRRYPQPQTGAGGRVYASIWARMRVPWRVGFVR